MAIGSMDKPTGPVGILSSSRPGVRSGGKKTMGGTKGIVSSPGKKMLGARKISGRR